METKAQAKVHPSSGTLLNQMLQSPLFKIDDSTSHTTCGIMAGISYAHQMIILDSQGIDGSVTNTEHDKTNDLRLMAFLFMISDCIVFNLQANV